MFEAYFEQFRTDFMLFLRSRSQEIVDGGRLVLVLTRSSDHHCPHWDWLTKSLLDLVHEVLLYIGAYHSVPAIYIYFFYDMTGID